MRGHAAHSSEAHRGVNAVHDAAEAIAFLAAASRRHARNGPTEAGFDPPFTTLQVSNLTCEGLPNTLPDRAGFDVEWRNIPADDPVQELARFQAHVATAIEPQMRELRPESGFDYEVLLDLAALSMPPEHELARAACAITGSLSRGQGELLQRGLAVSARRHRLHGVRPRRPVRRCISRTNGSRKVSSRCATPSCAGWSTGWRSDTRPPNG